MRKIYNAVVDFILEEYVFLISFFLSLIIFMWPVDYYITVGGGISSMDDRVILSEEYVSRGSLNLSYVREVDGRVGLYLLSFIIPGWEAEPISDYQNDEESMEDLDMRSKLSLLESNSTATKVAYTLAEKEIKEKSSELFVNYTFKEFPTEFKIGDQLLSIDDKTFNDKSSVSEYINTLDKEEVLVKVKRDKEEVTFKSKVYVYEDRKILGVGIAKVAKYETEPTIKLAFKENESGSSAGLMTALTIYDKLVKEDLTRKYDIAGTGTINEDGSVGSIGGVKYKLMGAVRGRADIFLVPNGENYEECVKLQKEKNYNITIIGISTLEEAISALERLDNKYEDWY